MNFWIASIETNDGSANAHTILDHSHNNVISEVDHVFMKSNYEKCHYMLISSSKKCKPVDIHNFHATKILDVFFSDSCKWNLHIQHICKIAYAYC